jgi:hypothetical protein
MRIKIEPKEFFMSDFSVVLCRPDFMLVSEEHPMKAHTNQWLLSLLSPADILCGATNQGAHHGVWGADAFAVIEHPRKTGQQVVDRVL